MLIVSLILLLKIRRIFLIKLPLANAVIHHFFSHVYLRSSGDCNWNYQYREKPIIR